VFNTAKGLFLSKQRYLSSLLIAVLVAVFSAVSAVADTPGAVDQLKSSLPAKVGEFKAAGDVLAPGRDVPGTTTPSDDFRTIGSATRKYVSPRGSALEMTLTRTANDGAAYAALKRFAADASKSQDVSVAGGIGALAYRTPNQIAFFKGPTFVLVSSTTGKVDQSDLEGLATQVSEGISSVDSDIPPLVKHLPDWIQAEQKASYAVSLAGLKSLVGEQPILETVDFTGGVEAVTADYNGSLLTIVEFTTPQMATVNDGRILKKLEELKASGQAIPSGYKRVGNYAVFVFNAPDGTTAENLIKSVSYEQVVQWLGNSPYILQRAQRAYASTTAGIILAVIKASGLALLMALGVGGIFGFMVFRKRRAKLAMHQVYSDAGGLVRLNIDELPVEANSGRLIGDGKQ
jgi:Family of unknown function (DUF6599)